MENVHIVRSIRRRSITLQILPDASIKVSAPYFMPTFTIKHFLKQHDDWIKRHQQRVLIRNSKKERDEYMFLGKSYELAERKNKKELVEVEDKMYVASANPKYIKNYLTSWYKQQARKIIIERVQRYARISGMHFKSVSITTAETRWGSCSSDRRLNFNWKLVMAPIEVIDYVVAHELAHLVELNHSKDFWETVRKMYPVYRQYRTWLKRNGDRLTV